MKILALAVALSGCTILGGGAGAGVTLAHNANVDTVDKWSYLAPVVTGALVGLVIDLLLLRSIGEGLGDLAKQ